MFGTRLQRHKLYIVPTLWWVQRRLQLGDVTTELQGYEAVLTACDGRRKYREGPLLHVEAQLKLEKKQQKGAAYVLGAKQETPGIFYVAYIANVNPHKEFMTVTPNGVYFRHEVRACSEATLLATRSTSS